MTSPPIDTQFMCIKASNTQKILVNELVALCVARDCAKSNEIRIWENDGRECRRLHVTALYGNSLCALTIPLTIVENGETLSSKVMSFSTLVLKLGLGSLRQLASLCIFLTAYNAFS